MDISMFSENEVSDLLTTRVLAPDIQDVDRMVPISGFYLGVTPPSNYHAQRPQSMSQASSSSVNGNAHKTQIELRCPLLHVPPLEVPSNRQEALQGYSRRGVRRT
jgi:hypothetical protein